MVMRTALRTTLLACTALWVSACATVEADQVSTLQQYLMEPTPGQGNVSEVIERSIADALVRLEAETGKPVRREMLRVYAWPEVWPDSTLGLGGIGLQAITIAQTVMVADPVSGLMVEYRGGRFVSIEPDEPPEIHRTNQRL